MGYFPMCVDLTGKRVLLVGEGKQIRDKMEKLRSFQAQLVALQSLSAEDLCPRPALVIVGDIERVRARAIAAMCVEADVPVNVVDVPELCTFFFPSLITRGDLTVSISTGGKSPAAAACLRRRVQKDLPDRTEEILDWLCAFRKKISGALPAPSRSALVQKAADLALAYNRPLREDECTFLLEKEMGRIDLQGEKRDFSQEFPQTAGKRVAL